METYVPKRLVFYAHRLSWELHFGPIPSGMHVLHKCDNPPCVNPKHLFLGAHVDNYIDMRKKNRHVKGEKFPHAKLTEHAVRTIRDRYEKGDITQKKLADVFGVSISQINGVVNRNTWRHIT